MKNIYLIIATIIGLICSSCTKPNSANENPENRKIYYTTTDGKPVTLGESAGFNSELVSNTYANGKGCLEFAEDLIIIHQASFRNSKTLKSITLPNTLEYIEEVVFVGCTALESFSGKFAINSKCLVTDKKLLVGFAQCGITDYKIPDGIEALNNYVFSWNENLQSITFPKSIQSIGQKAFYRCEALSEIHFLNPTPPKIMNEAFHYYSGDDPKVKAKVYVPKGSKQAYEAILGTYDFIFNETE